jgi:hypothetical protein
MQFLALATAASDRLEAAVAAKSRELKLECGRWTYRVVLPAAAAPEGGSGDHCSGSGGGAGTQDAGPFQENTATGKRRGLLRRVFFPILPRLHDGASLGDAARLDDVLRGSALWERVQTRVRSSLPGHRLVRVERIANRFLWERYCNGAWETARRNGGRAGERELFHHSANMDRLIHGTSGAGFDHRMKKVGGAPRPRCRPPAALLGLLFDLGGTYCGSLKRRDRWSPIWVVTDSVSRS